jgi:hypothetical protein
MEGRIGNRKRIEQKVNQARQSMNLKKDQLTVEAEERIRQEIEDATKLRNEKKLQVIVKKTGRRNKWNEEKT